ncbi:MAG: hypothetical protein IKH35_08855 [Prevotella sp.]|nr:hypothetical protein [Prevotella sp.]
MRESDRYEISQYKGRNRRLLYEWQQLDRRLEHRHDITCHPVRRNKEGLPTAYLVDYQLKSISGVENMEHFGEPGAENPPIFAKGFLMRIDLPDGYPSIDAAPAFRFLTHDEQGQPIPHPWHPNIRYFGDFAGRVCINMPDTYTDLAWAVERVAHYLRYEIYHAISEPPYPEDLKVAAWVVRQGEPKEWTVFEK